jgi:hypothetical protein
MSVAPYPEKPASVSAISLIAKDELMRLNKAAIELLDSWEAEGDQEEQRETMQVIRESLGKNRRGSNRDLFP